MRTPSAPLGKMPNRSATLSALLVGSCGCDPRPTELVGAHRHIPKTSPTHATKRKTIRRAAYKVSPVLGIGDTASTQGSATTQTSTAITWTPSDATAFGQQTDSLWTQLNAALVSCSTGQSGTATSATSTGQGNGLSAQQLANFEADYIAWEAFYQKAQNADAASWFGDSFDGLWWNTDTISDYQGKAAAWYNIIQTACPTATLPVLTPATPPSGLASLLTPSADSLKALTGAVLVGAALWFSWPLLSGLRKKNPRRRG